MTGQYASVDGDLTGRENLRLFARLAGLRGSRARSRADGLIERFGLGEAADRVTSTWSGGMRRRLDLAAGLVTRPRVLFLDEPTTGLDPAAREHIWTAVRALSGEGTTVLLTTQYLEEADRLADDIAVVSEGRVLAGGAPARLKALIGSRAEVAVAAREELAGAAAVLDGGITLPRIIRELDSAGVPVTDARLRPPTLDQVFLRVTRAGTARPEQETAA